MTDEAWARLEQVRLKLSRLQKHHESEGFNGMGQVRAMHFGVARGFREAGEELDALLAEAPRVWNSELAAASPVPVQDSQEERLSQAVPKGGRADGAVFEAMTDEARQRLETAAKLFGNVAQQLEFRSAQAAQVEHDLEQLRKFVLKAAEKFALLAEAPRETPVYSVGCNCVLVGPKFSAETCGTHSKLVSRRCSCPCHSERETPERTGPKCINCGDDKDGGFCTDEGEVGSFCASCWDELERCFSRPASPERTE